LASITPAALPSDEEKIVGLARWQRKFPDRHPAAGLAIQVVAVLQDPAGGLELSVDQLTGAGFGGAHGVAYSGIRA
jgi:hypothetical protein